MSILFHNSQLPFWRPLFPHADKNQDPQLVSIDQFTPGISSTLHRAESCFLFTFSFISQPSDGAHAVPLKPESYPLIHLANLNARGPASSPGKVWQIPNGNVYLWLFRPSRRLHRHATSVEGQTVPAAVICGYGLFSPSLALAQRLVSLLGQTF